MTRFEMGLRRFLYRPPVLRAFRPRARRSVPARVPSARPWSRAKLRRVRFFSFFFTALSAVLIISMLVDMKLNPIVRSYASAQAHYIALSAINNAALEVIDQNNIAYDNIISFEKTSDGTITALKTNMVLINKIKSKVTQLVLDDIEHYNRDGIRIPLGTILGGDLFAGRGPDVTLNISPVGSIVADYYNKFSSAGINQTRHQIMLHITASIQLIVSGKRELVEVAGDVSIAETIIVGSVPQSFTVIDGADTDSAQYGLIYGNKAASGGSTAP